ncbi:methyltransferase domain-containing protein [Desulfovirgula thermocuniculi]|uniref:spermine/spermidine synthase domain-containing protein n=1 Tax=Desulfovirgula thermocuniculi TaxID=348842 RepID=UPI0005579107|nr:methyltransferase domain-containing protein [Desulfovirgula thermocuniculi]
MKEVLREEEWYQTSDATTGGLRLYRVHSVVVRKKTPYQQVEILDVEKLGRSLFLDGVLQSAEADEYIYHELLVHPAMVAHPAPERVLVCGMGEGQAVREILRYPTVKEVVGVDIDREVVELCRQHLKGSLTGSPRCRLVFTNAAEYVATCPAGSFDVAVVDVTDDPFGLASTVLSENFFKELYRVLKEKGSVAVQGTSANYAFGGKGFSWLYRMVSGIFPTVLPYVEFIPSYEDLWGFLLCLKGLEGRPLQPFPPDLRYLDEETYRRAFLLPRPLRKALEKE